MNTYKLYIQKLETWYLVDMGDDQPAMNYQVNNIAELKNRQCDYSQALKLPLSKRNCALFDIPESMDVVTDIPYIKIPCRLFSNESVLAGTDSFIILNKVNKFIEVQILSGNANLFEILSKEPMSNLNLGEIVLNSDNFNPSNFGSNYFYGFASFILNPLLDNTTMQVIRACPFVKVSKIIDEIMSHNGYTLQTNIDSSKHAISISTRKAMDDSLFDAAASGSFTYHEAAGGDGPTFLIQQNGRGNLTVIHLASDYGSNLSYNGRAQYKLVVDVVVTCTGDPVIVTGFPLHGEAPSRSHIFTETLEYGMIASIITQYPWQSANVTYSLTCKYISVNDIVPQGGILSFSRNTGFEYQFDFFKAFVQLYGLTVDVDNVNKIVYAYSMQKLYDNKIVEKDWSLKLHDDDSDTDTFFKVDNYAQSNLIQFEKNEKLSLTDVGVLKVNDLGIDSEKELFTMKFESGIDYQYIRTPLPNITAANIPASTFKESGSVEFTGCKPHFVEVSEGTIPVMVLDGVVIKGTYDYHIVSHVKVQTIVDTYYSGLQTMLSSAKWKEPYFRLSDEDIEQFEKFEKFVPVYIQKFGHYFYVNKIVNYISGKLTKCQIIKL